MVFGSKFVETLLNTVGLGTIGLVGMDDLTLVRILRRRGCRINTISFDQFLGVDDLNNQLSFDCLLMPASFVADEKLFQQLRPFIDRLCKRFFSIAFADELSETSVKHISVLFNAGYRFSPSACRYVKDGLLIFERCATERSSLHPDRDFTRSTTPFASQLAELYSLVASFVRPNDTVFDSSDTLGSGPAFLAANSRAKEIFCMANSLADHSYLNNNFGTNPRIRAISLAENLDGQLPKEIGIAVSLFNSSHTTTLWLPLLRRLVRPDGRMIFSLSKSEFTHDDQELTIVGVATEISRQFIVEQKLDLHAFACSVFVVSLNPMSANAALTYSHPQFDSSLTQETHFIDIGGSYENPWLYRSMIQMGERIRDREKLAEIALSVIRTHQPTTPDYGAALTVIGYDIRGEGRLFEADAWRILADDYLTLKSDNQHVERWKISISYLRALLSLEQGHPRRALRDFCLCGDMDALSFSPLLATKTLGANFWAGLLYVTRDDVDAAKRRFRHGIQIARSALHVSDLNIIGNPDVPVDFGFQELAEVFDIASQITIALKSVDLHRHNPGLFWNRINMKRFGLATWALDLERENAELRSVLNTKKGL